MRIMSVAIFLLLAMTGGGASFATQSDGQATDFSRFAQSDPDSLIHIDHSGWTLVLRDIVLNVPPMDRNPERSRPITTGTRLSTGNLSRYRYEGNRVVYHLMPDEYRDAITTLRQDLETLPDRIGGLEALNRDEQLAYWFNLHNVAVVEQILAAYPIRNINRLRAPGSDQSLFEGPLLTVAGQTLSLNDIRLRIVFEQWDDPRIIYGFFNGSVGSPELRRAAFEGDQVWEQLDASADEFVNALRGVDVHRRKLRVSHVYDDARGLFDNFDRDLRRHLLAYANPETSSQLMGDRPLETNVADWQIADLINGSYRCRGSGGASPMLSYGWSEQGSGIANSCGVLPTNGRLLLNAVEQRRIELIGEGRYGEVFTNDLPSPDPDDTRPDEPANDGAD
ncbi:hypothetical protein AWH62_13770 [Maricaulis sp. W15]|nr:hypothetical protein AWH62_13770 [Maricaulis sp. W15]